MREEDAKLCADCLFKWCLACPQLTRAPTAAQYRPGHIDRIKELNDQQKEKLDNLFMGPIKEMPATALPGIDRGAGRTFAAENIYSVS